MTIDHKIILSNDVKVSFYPEDGTLEKMLEIASTDDFLLETEIMRKITCFPPFNLLVYDDILALGLYSNDVSVGMRGYSDWLLIEWVDTALSLRHHPIRVVEKTSQKGEMFRRLKPRIDLDWIEYDPETQVIREKRGTDCPAKRYLDSMPATKDLYSLSTEGKGTYVVHMRINDNLTSISPVAIMSGIRCESRGSQSYDLPLENVEKMLYEQNPEALVIRQPLGFCCQGIKQRPWGCLPHIYETVYANKVGFHDKSSSILDIPPINSYKN